MTSSRRFFKRHEHRAISSTSTVRDKKNYQYQPVCSFAGMKKQAFLDLQFEDIKKLGEPTNMTVLAVTRLSDKIDHITGRKVEAINEAPHEESLFYFSVEDKDDPRRKCQAESCVTCAIKYWELEETDFIRTFHTVKRLDCVLTLDPFWATLGQIKRLPTGRWRINRNHHLVPVIASAKSRHAAELNKQLLDYIHEPLSCYFK